MYTIKPIPAFNDNYIWCLFDGDRAVVVDPGCADSVVSFLTQHNLSLDSIIITHHHNDHTGGVGQLTQAYQCKVFGPINSPYPNIDIKLKQGDQVTLLDKYIFHILEIPGHTLDHIAYYDEHSVFCGDTLFSAGCGRLFEGTPEQMHRSLAKLQQIDGTPLFYPTHEYTRANLAFAEAVEPGNEAIQQALAQTETLRQQNKPTLPTTMAYEQRVNPFLRVSEPSVKAAVEARTNQNYKDEVAVFAAVRQWKDNF